MKDTCKSTIHYRYWILILLLLIVAVATDKWTGQAGFTDYLSNAATMTSLLLGLVAIIYSFVSNTTISSSLGSINSVSKEIGEVNQRIGNYISLAEAIEKSGKASVDSLETFSIEMRQGLNEFSGMLSTLDEKNNAMHRLISMLPEKMDSLNERFAEVTHATKQANGSGSRASSSTNLGRDVVERLFLRSSPSEILFVYCCIKSFETTKRIVPADICKVLDLREEHEARAFIRCLDSVGLLYLLSDPRGQALRYKITWMHDYLSSDGARLAKAAVANLFPGSDEQDDLKTWLVCFDDVDRFYTSDT